MINCKLVEIGKKVVHYLFGRIAVNLSNLEVLQICVTIKASYILNSLVRVGQLKLN